MSPRTGRPRSDNPRQIRVESRMTTQELAKLDFCCEKTGMSRSKVIREGIGRIYAELCDTQT